MVDISFRYFVATRIVGDDDEIAQQNTRDTLLGDIANWFVEKPADRTRFFHGAQVDNAVGLVTGGREFLHDDFKFKTRDDFGPWLYFA